MNCDPLARWYRWLEYAGFGRALERRRLEFLGGCRDATRVLMLGEGDGRFLAAFLKVNRTARVDYVDCSREMLTLAERRAATLPAEDVGSTDRVHFHHADALMWLQKGVAGPFDLVTFHFFLDCFTQSELTPLVDAVSQRSAPEAHWFVSEFRYAPRGWAAFWTRGFIRGLYLFFRLVTGLNTHRLPRYDHVFEAAGFHRLHEVLAGGGILVSEWWKRG